MGEESIHVLRGLDMAVKQGELLAIEGRASRREPFIAGTEPKRSAPPLEPEEEEGAETGHDGYVEVGSDPSEHPSPDPDDR